MIRGRSENQQGILQQRSSLFEQLARFAKFKCKGHWPLIVDLNLKIWSKITVSLTLTMKGSLLKLSTGFQMETSTKIFQRKNFNWIFQQQENFNWKFQVHLFDRLWRVKKPLSSDSCRCLPARSIYWSLYWYRIVLVTVDRRQKLEFSFDFKSIIITIAERSRNRNELFL